MNFSLGRYQGDIYQIKEWQIMVHIIQGRDFLGEEINPYICIQIDDQKRYTGVHRSTNAPFFGEVNLFSSTIFSMFCLVFYIRFQSSSISNDE